MLNNTQVTAIMAAIIKAGKNCTDVEAVDCATDLLTLAETRVQAWQ